MDACLPARRQSPVSEAVVRRRFAFHSGTIDALNHVTSPSPPSEMAWPSIVAGACFARHLGSEGKWGIGDMFGWYVCSGFGVWVVERRDCACSKGWWQTRRWLNPCFVIPSEARCAHLLCRAI